MTTPAFKIICNPITLYIFEQPKGGASGRLALTCVPVGTTTEQGLLRNSHVQVQVLVQVHDQDKIESPGIIQVEVHVLIVRLFSEVL